MYAFTEVGEVQCTNAQKIYSSSSNRADVFWPCKLALTYRQPSPNDVILISETARAEICRRGIAGCESLCIIH